MERFDNNNLKEVRKKIETALKILGDEMDVFLTIGNIRYDSNSFRTTLSATMKPKMITVVERGLELTGPIASVGDGQYVGRKFKSNKGIEYTIHAINYRQYKYPVIAADASGNKFKFKEDVLERLLA